jgi:MFS family permease
MTRYHWFVMVVAALGWLFDCLDQQLFVLARPAAMKELLPGAEPDVLNKYGAYATSIFLLGWGAGGLIFGVLGDRIGRAKTMLITILLYSAFTGLSSLSYGFWDFAVYRFLTGLGVGGEFAVGVALVAEVMPDRARPYCLMLLQMLSAVGNVAAALINMSLGVLEEHGLVASPWRTMFLIGSLPALLAVVIRYRLKEPERWLKMRHEDALSKQLGSYRELFGKPLWRRHAIIGLLLAFSGVVGLWAVGFFTPDLTKMVMRPQIIALVFDEEIQKARDAGDAARLGQLEVLRTLNALGDVKHASGTAPAPIPEELAGLKSELEKSRDGRITFWGGVTSLTIQIGAFFGMFGFGYVAQRIGRKPAFLIAFLAAFASTAVLFWSLDEFHQLFWLVPLMGFCQLSLFAGYAMYFPELFPTHLRSTGTSFCYNVGRFVAASGPFVQGHLNSVFKDTAEPLRYAGLTMCGVFLIGLFVLPLAPETKGKPLPE